MSITTDDLPDPPESNDPTIFERVGITPPSEYHARAVDGDVTWLEDAIEEYLNITVTAAQRTICRCVASNKKTIIQTANGLGKSYILAAIANIWITVHQPAIAFATSGTYPKLKRTFCKPVENLHDNALMGVGLPGTYKQSPPRIEFEDDAEDYFEASSPKDTGELEGAHAAWTLGIIEEADKVDVTRDTVEAMDSLLTDERDRLVAIANPPKDDLNVVHELREDQTWEEVTLSSFDSHNVEVELGEVEGERVDGLATLDKIKEDWQSYNAVDWPGVEAARNSYGEKGLDDRWYRRRLGRTPPDSSDAWRPISKADVEAAYNRTLPPQRETPTGVGIDVARSGDDTVLSGKHQRELRIHYDKQGNNHRVQGPEMKRIISEWPEPPIAIDAVGEGSGLADDMDAWFPNVDRFANDNVAAESTEYENLWSEGLYYLGKFLEDGSISDADLREELIAAAQTVEFGKKHIKSRGQNGEDVVTATPKEEIKDRLGRSPDRLDSALMAIWIDEHGARTKSKTQVFDGVGQW